MSVPARRCTKTARILLANLLQSSMSTFSWGFFLSFFAFKEGMLGLDHGIGHFMLVEVDSEAQAAVPPMSKIAANIERGF